MVLFPLWSPCLFGEQSLGGATELNHAESQQPLSDEGDTLCVLFGVGFMVLEFVSCSGILLSLRVPEELSMILALRR